jgi:hypothetical protein
MDLAAMESTDHEQIGADEADRARVEAALGLQSASIFFICGLLL